MLLRWKAAASRRAATLNPVIVIVSLFFWDWLWDIPGALLSVPLLAIFKIVCDRIPVLMPLGDMLGASERRNAVPRPARRIIHRAKRRASKSLLIQCWSRVAQPRPSVNHGK